MNIQEVRDAKDEDEFLISGADLKMLLNYGLTLNSGLSPKGEMCFLYGKTLIAITERVEESK